MDLELQCALRQKWEFLYAKQRRRGWRGLPINNACEVGTELTPSLSLMKCWRVQRVDVGYLVAGFICHRPYLN